MRGRHGDRARRHRPALHPHARSPAGALLPRGQRPDARRRSVDRPHGRLALRRRCRAARPRGRGARGRGGPLPLAAPARRARRRRRGVSGARRRLAVREGDELEGVDDDRLRAALQPGAGARRHRALHRRVHRRLGTAAAEHGTHRGDEPRPVRRRAARAERARCARSGHTDPGRAPRSRHSRLATTPARSAFPSPARDSRRRRHSCSSRPDHRSRHRTRTRSRSPREACTRSATSTSPATSSEADRRRSSSSRSSSSTHSSRTGRSSSTCARRRSATRATSPAAATSRTACSRSARPISRATSRSSRSARRVRARRSPRASSRAHGFDAHPVVNGGIDSWVAAGKPTVEFRRCGS